MSEDGKIELLSLAMVALLIVGFMTGYAAGGERIIDRLPGYVEADGTMYYCSYDYMVGGPNDRRRINR